MIVLTEQQKYLVKGKYGKFKELNPIQIKNNLYILPEVVLLDSDYPLELLNTFEIREVNSDEFIQEEI